MQSSDILTELPEYWVAAQYEDFYNEKEEFKDGVLFIIKGQDYEVYEVVGWNNTSCYNKEIAKKGWFQLDKLTWWIKNGLCWVEQSTKRPLKPRTKRDILKEKKMSFVSEVDF